MNKKYFLLVIPLIITIFLLSNVMAFMPPTHQYLDYQAIKTFQGNSDYFNICNEYPKQCYIGNVLTDMSVAYYYTNKGKRYEVTHNPQFCVNMIKEAKNPSKDRGIPQRIEMACAIGSCIHQAEDVVSHTKMVPKSIVESLIVNQVIHVFAEQHLDNIVLEQHPEVRTLMNGINESDWMKCIPLMKEVLEKNSDWGADPRLDETFYGFISEVKNSVSPDAKTSYDVAFKSKVGMFGNLALVPGFVLLIYIGLMVLFGLMFVLIIFKKSKTLFNYLSLIIFFVLFAVFLIFFIALLNGKGFDMLITFIKPISNLVPIGGGTAYLDNGIENVKQFFVEGEKFLVDNQLVASGFKELQEANDKIMFIDYLIGILIVVAIILLIYFNIKKKPTQVIYKSML